MSQNLPRHRYVVGDAAASGPLPFGLHEPPTPIFKPKMTRRVLRALGPDTEVYGRLPLVTVAKICARGARYFHQISGNNWAEMSAEFKGGSAAKEPSNA